MLRNTAEILPECRECLGLVEAVAEIAIAQAQLKSEPEVYALDPSGKGFTYSGKLSNLWGSEAGRLARDAEEQVLEILELATFCTGQSGDCFKDKLANTTHIDDNPIAVRYEAPPVLARSSITSYRWVTGLL